MTRKEEIYKAARDYLFNFFIPSGVRIEEWNTCFEAGAKWADEHPKNPWRDAKKDPPKEWENVFVMMTTGTPTCGYRENDDYHLDADYLRGEVALWMPIPELKGGEI